MSLLDDARALLGGTVEPHGLAGRSRGTVTPSPFGPAHGYVYWFCGGDAPMADGHAPGCPWLRRGEILAVVEAALKDEDS